MLFLSLIKNNNDPNYSIQTNWYVKQLTHEV
jgi:hypothetical protein